MIKELQKLHAALDRLEATIQRQSAIIDGIAIGVALVMIQIILARFGII